MEIGFSSSTCGEPESALEARARHDSSSCAKPEPRPPSANAARRMTGNPMRLAAVTAASVVVAG